MSRAKQFIKKILSQAGITIDGSDPWDIRVKDERFYDRVLVGGSLAVGEAYMDGWWDVLQLDEFFARVLSAELEKKIVPTGALLWEAVRSKIFNYQKKSRAFEIGKRHYDIGNDLYQAMLDKRLTYTCGYWKNLEQKPENLDAAQEAKLDLVCRKLGLKNGDTVLDIGCGWGSFAKFAAEKYGAKVTGVTVSKEQTELARELCQGLPVEIKLIDYREVTGEFDHIVSLGMFEHVGYKNYRKYMNVVSRCLKDSGLFLLHTIGSNQSTTNTDLWIEKYIFPNSMLPSIAQISKSIEKLFVMEDWHNFSFYYYPTLIAWFTNFNRAWPKLKEKYGERFYRQWKYYLLASAGNFKARKNQLWQIVLSKKGVPGGYEPII
jgi:cyclopropane-fatty-acyl-phospholipid synthase